MKVLIVHHQMALYGGAELVVVRLARYLQEQGHETRILAASSAPHPEYKSLDIITPSKEISWHIWDGSVNSLQELYQVFLALRKLCSKYVDNYDVVNAHNFPAVWAVPRHKKLIWMCNEVPDLWHSAGNGRMVNKLFDVGRLGDRLITRSKSPMAVVPDASSAKRFYHRYGLTPKIIPYGIDGKFFYQPATVDKEGFTILQPSMISPSKNQMAILKAANNLKHTIPKLKVVFAGYKEQTPYLEELTKYIVEHNLNATFTGMLSREDLKAWYNSAHIAIFPGKGQGSWLGPFEALATGCPIIVSPNLPCSSVVATRGTISDNLVGTIQHIYNDYPLFKQQALKGQEFVINNLTWDKFGEKFLEVLNEVKA